MNFLAHIFLSGDNQKITIGNFLGDFVKGVQMEDFEPEIRTGIVLHREIDSYTDAHPVVLKSKERLRPKYSHYSPVIVDVFYDHFLAKKWESYSSEDLEIFTTNFYGMTKEFHDVMPHAATHMLTYMKRDNWLYNYQLTEGIDRALTGMSRRTKFESKMEHAAKDLVKDYEEFSSEFSEFFPDLQRHCHQFISANA